jgi:hypothetical protein
MIVDIGLDLGSVIIDVVVRLLHLFTVFQNEYGKVVGNILNTIGVSVSLIVMHSRKAKINIAGTFACTVLMIVSAICIGVYSLLITSVLSATRNRLVKYRKYTLTIFTLHCIVLTCLCYVLFNGFHLLWVLNVVGHLISSLAWVYIHKSEVKFRVICVVAEVPGEVFNWMAPIYASFFLGLYRMGLNARIARKAYIEMKNAGVEEVNVGDEIWEM